jgi:hypothetical protein
LSTRVPGGEGGEFGVENKKELGGGGRDVEGEARARGRRLNGGVVDGGLEVAGVDDVKVGAIENVVDERAGTRGDVAGGRDAGGARVDAELELPVTGGEAVVEGGIGTLVESDETAGRGELSDGVGDDVVDGVVDGEERGATARRAGGGTGIDAGGVEIPGVAVVEDEIPVAGKVVGGGEIEIAARDPVDALEEVAVVDGEGARGERVNVVVLLVHEQHVDVGGVERVDAPAGAVAMRMSNDSKPGVGTFQDNASLASSVRVPLPRETGTTVVEKR